MIYFVSCAPQAETHKAVSRALPEFRRLPYPLLFGRRSAPRGSYIFSDFDRLSFWQLELAALAYRALRDAGCPVYNDPAIALHRLQLLRKLNATGINSFQAWSAHDKANVNRFPVFVRTGAAHRGVLTDLLANAESLSTALAALIDKGFPLNDLIIVEYRAAPMENGVFRKLAAYKIGGVIVSSPSVYEDSWTAKYGTKGAAGEAGYIEDLNDIRAGRFASEVRSAFKVANIDYGRADFGVVDGRCEFYEINTNPMHYPPDPHPFPARLEAIAYTNEKVLRAISALNVDQTGPRIKLDFDKMRPNRGRRDKILPGYLWTP